MVANVGPACSHNNRLNPLRGYDSILKLRLFVLTLAGTYISLQILAFTQLAHDVSKLAWGLNNTKQSRPISKTVPPPYSKVQCIGESFDDHHGAKFRAMYRSCRYKNLCYKLDTNELVLFPTSQHQKVLSLLDRNGIYLSSVPKPVMPNPILSSRMGKLDLLCPKYLKAYDDYNHNQILNTSHVIWIPILPNLGESLLLDLFFPVYRLLELFDLESEPYGLFFLKSSNSTRQRLESFLTSLKIERPLIVYDADILANNNPSTPNFIRLENSVMGMGALGIHRQQYHARNTSIPPNHIGRGRTVHKFRDYILKKMDIHPDTDSSFTIGYSNLIPQSMLPHPGYMGLKWLLLSSEGSFSLRHRILEIRKLFGLILTSKEDKTPALFLQDSRLLILIGEPQEDWDFWSNVPYIKLFLLTQNIPMALEKVIYSEMMILDFQRAEKERSNKENTSHLNGFPFELKAGPPKPTTIHCIGEKLYPDAEGAHQFRSRYFENICFHLVTKQFKIVQPANFVIRNDTYLQDGNYFSNVFKPLAISPQAKMMLFDIKPEKIGTLAKAALNASYYHFQGVLLANKVLSSCNPGHLFWDMWLPLFSIMEIFNLSKEALTVTKLSSKRQCKEKVSSDIEELFVKNVQQVDAIFKGKDREASIVCATKSALGYGWLSDHGLNSHGWVDKDMDFPINIGRGPELRRLRSFALQNMSPSASSVISKPYQIVFSINSSRDKRRRTDFQDQFVAVQDYMNRSSLDVIVKQVHVVSLSIPLQIAIASKTSIFISASGGGSLPAFFLLKGASLILYGDENMHLDCDLFNNYGLGNVHWMSMKSRHNDTNLLLQLLIDEIESFEVN